MPTITPELVAAAAAILAAILSGLTFLISGRRDERRWRREALTEVLVTLLDTSFKGPPSEAFELRLAGESPDRYRQNAIDSHAEMVNSMTRLRMLARSRVVKEAEKLHDVQDQIYDAIYMASDLMTLGEFHSLVRDRRRLRNEFVKLARRNLGLFGATPIDDNAKGGPNMRDVVKEVPSMRVHLVRDRG